MNHLRVALLTALSLLLHAPSFSQSAFKPAEYYVYKIAYQESKAPKGLDFKDVQVKLVNMVLYMGNRPTIYITENSKDPNAILPLLFQVNVLYDRNVHKEEETNGTVTENFLFSNSYQGMMLPSGVKNGDNPKVAWKYSKSNHLKALTITWTSAQKKVGKNGFPYAFQDQYRLMFYCRPKATK